MTLGPSGAKTSEWNYLQYGIARGSETYDWWKLLNYDMLVINIGYNGTLTMTTPVILKGKYKVTLFFAYEPTMKFMGERANNSNGGLLHSHLMVLIQAPNLVLNVFMTVKKMILIILTKVLHCSMLLSLIKRSHIL